MHIIEYLDPQSERMVQAIVADENREIYGLGKGQMKVLLPSIVEESKIVGCMRILSYDADKCFIESHHRRPLIEEDPSRSYHKEIREQVIGTPQFVSEWGKNLIVDNANNGKRAIIRALFATIASGTLYYINVGTGTTAANSNDTGTETIIDDADPGQVFSSRTTLTTSGFINTIYGKGQNNAVWQEATLFNQNNDLISRVVGSTPLPFTKDNTKIVTLEWQYNHG